jgi:SAM-dependent methyltransferase
VSETAFAVPSELYRGNLKENETEYLASARWLLQWMPELLGWQSLEGRSMLDVGCGTKFTQALLNDGIPVARYAGVDVYREMVEYLAANVTDPRFSYHHMNTQNEMYNPGGERLGDDTRLPLGNERFDLICLFSVFTHLEPHDYPHMLRMLRHQIKDDGRLVYSLFVDQASAGGHGLLDQVCKKLGVPWTANGQPFFDGNPSKPLHQAIYSAEYARELTEGTGWEIVELGDPQPYVQHHFVCRPV